MKKLAVLLALCASGALAADLPVRFECRPEGPGVYAGIRVDLLALRALRRPTERVYTEQLVGRNRPGELYADAAQGVPDAPVVEATTVEKPVSLARAVGRHLARNKWRYASGLAAAGVTAWGARTDWWGLTNDGDSGPAGGSTNTQNSRTATSTRTADDHRVIYTYNVKAGDGSTIILGHGNATAGSGSASTGGSP